MFGRKKKPERTLCARAVDGTVLFDGSPMELKLPEPEILRLSVQFFDDPEPCHIHRAAVQSRVILELCECCEGKGATAIPDALRSYFELYDNAETIEIRLQ